MVLVEPEGAANVGAAARVIKNFGLGRLVLVAARMDRPAEALSWAHGAEDVLEGAELAGDLASALQGCVKAWATTRRRGRFRGAFLDVRAAAAETAALARAGGETAWVFGPESRGLANPEVALCSARVTIATSPAQPSLNLAQAVAVCAYETRAAWLADAAPAAAREAPLADREAFYRHLERALGAAGFLLPHTARARMAALKSVFERARLTSRELRLLRGMARQVEWAGRHAAPGEPAPPPETPEAGD